MPLGINRGLTRPIRSAARTAPGYRNFPSGIPGSVGSRGYSWSCTPATGDVTVQYLDFGTQGLNTSSSYYRALGLQLRCLSE
ncbi:hypothetical protein [uncultured Rikenella sp.]|uniref:hypothetical protein n=1 Tax=uncultured Rikenella sp. TaxID=368003 RepID=UPI0025F8F417|nr:hypothetical protein [uncultured Rikenella sp.]